MGCSESHAFMGSDTADLGKWYDVNAHKYVKYLPLCENTTHENPISKPPNQIIKIQSKNATRITLKAPRKNIPRCPNNFQEKSQPQTF